MIGLDFGSLGVWKYLGSTSTELKIILKDLEEITAWTSLIHFVHFVHFVHLGPLGHPISECIPNGFVIFFSPTTPELGCYSR